MGRVTSVIISSESELIYFQQRVKYTLGIEFPLEYLKNGLIRGFKNERGSLVGGYALILKGKLRTLSSIPEGQRNYPYPEEQMMEVTALWRDRSFGSGVSSFQFWYQFSRDVLSLKEKKYMVYAYDIGKKKLQGLYSKGGPRVLFRGETIVQEGMEESALESIEVVPARTLLYLPYISLPYFFMKSATLHWKNFRYALISLYAKV